MLLSGLDDVELSHFEYCFLVNTSSPSASSFMVHFPKLMPLVSPSDQSVRQTIPTNIFANAADCKPSVSSSVNTQGFIRVNRFRDANLSHKPLVMNKGERFIAVFMDGNIRDPYITGHI